MIVEKRNALKPLIESSRGVHLSAYIINNGDLNDLKSQIKDVIQKAEKELLPAMSMQKMQLFLHPIKLLLKNDDLLKSFKHNIGFFRTLNSFRVLAVPVAVESFCSIATTFHVKPLLKWMTVDKEFLLLGIEGGEAYLYQGSQYSLNLISTLKITDNEFTGLDLDFPKTVESFSALESLSEWISKHTRLTKPKLFMMGNFRGLSTLKRVLPYPSQNISILGETFSKNELKKVAKTIRQNMEAAALKYLENLIVEFRAAEKRNSAGRNIFQIAKAVAEGRVRKIMIADGIKLYGRFNSKSGKLKIHYRDVNHEDDDVLDDLAQSVITHGGDVFVVPKTQMPEDCLAWAVFDPALKENDLNLGIKPTLPINYLGVSL